MTSTDFTEIDEFDLDVTKEDIERGKREDCLDCPIALALSRQFNGYTDVGRLWANTEYGRFEHDGRLFIDTFDDGIDVEPTTVHFKKVKS